MEIDANIVRHSRKEVVNDIEKHPKQVPEVLKMVARRGPGPPFWVPGGWTSLLGLFGSHVAPQSPPGRLLEDFGAHLGAKTMIKRKRDDLWKYLFHICNIAVFRGGGRYLGCQKERKTDCESDPDSNSVL